MDDELTDSQSSSSPPPSYDAIGGEIPACSVCLQCLGTNGGPASLPCGHNGCLLCLEQVQASQNCPLCPLCRTPFGPTLQLCPNTELRDAIDQLLRTSQVFRSVEGRDINSAVSTVSGKGCTEVEDKQSVESDDENTWVAISHMPEGNERFDWSESGVIRYVENVEDEIREQTNLSDFRLWDVFAGAFAIMTGRGTAGTLGPKIPPSAPPLYPTISPAPSTAVAAINNVNVRALRTVLDAEPPQWVPDSGSSCCMQCGKCFRAITCLRHHCRFCGGLFCYGCSRARCLLPVRFQKCEPQRVCDTCRDRLLPAQQMLAERVSNAAQVALHDVTDWSSARALVNSPLGLSLGDDIFKAAVTLRQYSSLGQLDPERSIPTSVLRGALGLALVTVIRVGVMLTYRLGTGVVVARRQGPNGGWTGPSAVATCGIGWGVQAGGDLTDLVIVLRSQEAVSAFSGVGHLALGGAVSVTAGPMGRHAEAEIRVGDRGSSPCYSYSFSKGAFVGVSIEGHIFATRKEANFKFYGDASITAAKILSGAVPTPRAASPLYSALDNLFGKFDDN